MITGSLIKRGKYWHAVYNLDGRQHWQSTRETNKAKARAILQDIVSPLQASDRARALRDAAESQERDAAEATGRRMRLSEMWMRFAQAPERPDSGPVTMQSYDIVWRRFHEWISDRHPKATTVSDVSHQIAADFATHLLGEVGSSTFNRNIGTLRLIWKTLNKRTGSNVNPWLNVSMRRSQPNSRRELTIDELTRLASTATGEMRVMIALGTYTGLRLVDCATLKRAEVDLHAGVIRRIPKKTSRKNGKLVTVPIHRGLMPILAEQLALHPEAPDVLPAMAQQWKRRHIDRLLRNLFDAAGITRLAEDTPNNRVRRPVLAGFHSLRHTFVSICRNAGVPEAFVQSIVGHSNPAMTRHYTHIGDEAAQSAIAALPEIGRAKASTEIQAQENPQRNLLPAWAKAELERMDAENWREIRDTMLNQSPSGDHRGI